MGAEFYSSSICWNNRTDNDVDAGRKLAEEIGDEEERAKVLEALNEIPESSDGGYYSSYPRVGFREQLTDRALGCTHEISQCYGSSWVIE